MKIILIHGSYGSADENWFPWLSDEIKKLNIDVIAPNFPTPNGQSLDSWQKVFDEEVGELGSNDILVGHSLGVGFILNLLEQSNTPVAGCFFVSGFIGNLKDEAFNVVNKTFVDKDFDWDKINQNAGKVKIYHSNDDPYVPMPKAEEIAKNMNTDITVVPNGGHLNADAGYLQFFQLSDDIKEILKK